MTDTHAADPADRREDLVARLLEHCGHMCVTGDEDEIATAMVDRYTHLGERVQRVGNSVVVGEAADCRPLVLLVGHLDVVPPTDDDREPRVETVDGEEAVIARGASDMKAGNVVAMRAFEDLSLRRSSPFTLALLLYAGEEGPGEGNELRDVLAAVPWLAETTLAVVLEPTDGEVQVGCLGSLHAELTFPGQQAHSARPWHGENALTAAGTFLTELHDDHLREVVIDDITYVDVWSATQAWTPGLGPGDVRTTRPVRNVIPGAFTLNLNLRFAPSRSATEAEAEVRARVGGRAEVTVVDAVPGAPPRLDDAIVQEFVSAVGAEVAAKQAWTDVARFAEIGVPALNYGPGLTGQAHQRGEYVPVDAMVDADERLQRFLRGDHGAADGRAS
ncbi:MAG: succinyl-diaminopimelate desuccinylase [Nitriliruptoraceae bacterium]|nr:succinyl-diaminopimelate desuccinylase [Nitriliruptoraceae bacterium]